MSVSFHLTVRLECAPERAFSLFTTRAGLESWLAPVAEVSTTVGGPYELFWDPGDRTANSTLGCVVTAIAPDALIAFDWRGPRQFASFMNEADPLTHVTVAFAPVAGGTEVHLVHAGWRRSPDWEEARAWQQRAWTLAFDTLARRVNGTPAPVA